MDDGVPMKKLAVELVDVYREARTLEDEEYAAQAIDDLLDAVEDDTDDGVLVALLELPETELTAPLLEDVVGMLADIGSRAVGRLLELVAVAKQPPAAYALEALDLMDVPELVDGLFDVLAGDGPTGLRLLAADGLVALGHDGARRLDEALTDPWTSRLAQLAVDRRDDAGLALSAGRPSSDEIDSLEEALRLEPATAPPEEAGPADAEAEPSSAPPAAPALGEVLDAEYDAFLERFERESDG